MEVVAILATAIDRTHNRWGGEDATRPRRTNLHLSVIHPRHLVLNASRSSHVTSGRTEHHSVLLTAPTECSTSNLNVSLTAVFSMSFLQTCRHTSGVVVFKVTHRTVSTTTIYVVIDSGGLVLCLTNCHFRATFHLSGSNVIAFTLTAAINVAILNTALAFSANGSTSNVHFRAAIHTRFFTTSVDTLANGSCAFNIECCLTSNSTEGGQVFSGVENTIVLVYTRRHRMLPSICFRIRKDT